jgi:hypothetical protein
MKTPTAKKAVDEELPKLSQDTPSCSRTGKAAKCGAWDIVSVRPKADVQAEAKRKGTATHFGSLMDLCHEEHNDATNHTSNQTDTSTMKDMPLSTHTNTNANRHENAHRQESS